jgi:hypothetical protein
MGKPLLLMVRIEIKGLLAEYKQLRKVRKKRNIYDDDDAF